MTKITEEVGGLTLAQLRATGHWVRLKRVPGAENVVAGDDVIADVADMSHERVDEALGALETRGRSREWTSSDALPSSPGESWPARKSISAQSTRPERLSVSATGKTSKHEPLERWVGRGRAVEQP
jgi:hypothetical protein